MGAIHTKIAKRRKKGKKKPCPMDYYDFESTSDSVTSQESKTSVHLSIEEMIEIHMDLLKESLNPIEILPRLSSILETQDFRRIKSLSHTEDAVNELINVIKGCKDGGKWQLFLEALNKAEYKSLTLVLQGELDPCKDENNKKILKLFHEKITESVYLPEMLETLYSKKVISEVDYDQIEKENKTRGQYHASTSLLLRIPARHPNWFKLFIEALRECKMEHIVNEIESINDEVVVPRKGVRDLPPLPSIPFKEQTKEDLSLRDASLEISCHGMPCKPFNMKTIAHDKDNSEELCHLKGMIEKRMSEVYHLRSRYLVLQAEEDIYETIPCDDENAPRPKEAEKSYSYDLNGGHDDTIQKRSDDDMMCKQAIDQPEDTDGSYWEQKIERMISDVISTKVQSQIDDLKLHFTKEIQSFRHGYTYQHDRDIYRSMNVDYVPVKIFDVSCMRKHVHDYFDFNALAM